MPPRSRLPIVGRSEQGYCSANLSPAQSPLDLRLPVGLYPCTQYTAGCFVGREDFMKVSIKEFDVAMDVKKKGIEFDVYEPGEDGTRLGD